MLRFVLALALLVGSGCNGGGDLTPEESLSKSCNGDVIPNCRPYEYAIVREASVSPDGVEVGDPLATIDVRFVIDACADAPMMHAVSLQAVDATGGAGDSDAGPTGRMTTLDTFYDNSSRDDNMEVGVFEGSVQNFFLMALVNPNTDLVLTFEPRIDVCHGGSIELPYSTGPAYVVGGP